MAEMFDDGPFAAEHRAEGVVAAAAVFLQVAAAHHLDLMALIVVDLLAAQKKAIDFGVP